MTGPIFWKRNGGNTMTDENTNKMRVILCRPGEKAETIEIDRKSVV